MTHLPFRGRLWWREEFYSICSAHRYNQKDCPTCQTGQWRNVYRSKLSSLVFRYAPGIWRWWANRPNSSFRRWMRTEGAKRAFPNLTSTPKAGFAATLRYLIGWKRKPRV